VAFVHGSGILLHLLLLVQVFTDVELGVVLISTFPGFFGLDDAVGA